MVTMESKDLVIRMPKLHYTIPIHSKYTVITGESGTGKSTMLHLKSDDLVLSSDALVIVSLLALETACASPKSLICLIDEDILAYFEKEQIELINASNNRYVFITRKLDERFPINYKDIYILHCSGKYYTCKRKYPDYDTFHYMPKYLCEDKKSGFLYFSKWLPNVESADGKSNLSAKVHPQTLVIADGAAIGPDMEALCTVTDIQLYLPISFEYLCYKYLVPQFNMSEIEKAWELGDHNSLEQLFTQLLEVYCVKMFHTAYSKKHYPFFLENVSLEEFLKLAAPPEVIQWCRDNAPTIYAEYSDTELWEQMKELYTKCHK